ncbi:helix-turn-helix domain-containing protein [Kitasatospora indigofera]|uniref:helix-turn-helix domain-containing protein n=1 Tax=Kitasatospora indigofera TaxID=67307 RepID=UPI00368DFEE4
MSVNDLTVTAPTDLRGLLTSCRGRIEVSQERVAGMVGVSSRHYGNLERGNVQRPSKLLLDRVADVLKMSTAEKQSMYRLVRGAPAA